MYSILVADPISDHGLQQLTEAKDVQIDRKTGLSEAEIIEIIPAYDALLVRSQTKVTNAIMAAGKNLKVIGRAGVGVDNIDLAAATEHGIIVINAPDGNTITTCEHAFAMMMALARHIPQAYKKTTTGEWDRKSFVGVELLNKTLAVVGMGRIGNEVAKRAKAFGMEVIAYDPFLSEERAEKLGIELGSVAEIVAKADFITVHTPLTKETHHMISTEQFQLMKPGVRIINCARGGIIDEAALLQAIEQNIVAGAAFDVFEEEPPSPDHPFLHHPKIIVTPHLGASTIEAQENVAIDVAEQVLHILRDEPFKNAVNLPPVPAAIMKKLQPYFTLGEKLGQFVAQIAEGAVSEITVQYSGELAEVDTTPLTRYIVKGVIAHHLGLEQVNLINSMHLAKGRDVNVVIQKSSASKGFTNLITVQLKTNQQTRKLSGTLLNGYGARIVQLDDYTVDIASTNENLLIISHNDKPGMIGQVGMLLGDGDINIATMQVGRKDVGGSAIMVLVVDRVIPKDVADKLTTLPGLISAKEIQL